MLLLRQLGQTWLVGSCTLSLSVALDHGLHAHLFGLSVPSAHLPAGETDKAKRADTPVESSSESTAGDKADAGDASCGGHAHQQTASRTRHRSDARKVVDRINRRNRRPDPTRFCLQTLQCGGKHGAHQYHNQERWPPGGKGSFDQA